MRFTFISIIMLLPLYLAGEEKIPPQAQLIINDYNSEKRSATDKAVKKLKELQTKITKTGNLDAANQIQSIIADIEKSMPEKKIELKFDAKSLAGKWKFSLPGNQGTLSFEKNGSVTHPAGISGQYKQDATGQSGVISWANGTSWTVSAKDGGYIVTAPDGISESELQKIDLVVP